MRKNLFLTLIVLGIVIIGASAMFALANRSSLRLSGGSPADVEVLARVIARGEDRIAPTELAGWIIQDRKDVLLIDIRPPEQFSAQHIRTARNIPVTRLLKREILNALPDDRVIVLYSQGTEQAAQAGALLRLAGYQASFLAGGFDGWQEQVLYPRLATAPGDAESRKRQAVARHFGGDVQATAATVGQEALGPGSEISTPSSPPSSVLSPDPSGPEDGEKPAFTPPLTPATEVGAPAGEQQGSDAEGTLIVDEGC
jgi:rhodanese-related sulfurtransferase